MPKSRQPEYKTAGYLIPDVLDPDECICVCVPVPNDERHIQAFKAQLFALSRWWTWERDSLKRGKDAAAVWAGIYECVEARMDNNCGCGGSTAPEPMIRFAPDGTLEASYDGGQTWQPAPQLDPRLTSIQFPPMPGADGDAKRCNAAWAAAKVIEDDIIQKFAETEVGITIFGVIVAAIALYLSAGALTPLVMAIVGAAMQAGSAAIQAAFTAQVWEDFRCILYCNMGDDASFTVEQWQAVKIDINGTFTGIVATLLDGTVNAFGSVGMTNAARSNRASGTGCDTCPCEAVWCYEFDFLTVDGGFANVSGSNYGNWVSGQGWVSETVPGSGGQSIWIKRDFVSVITRVEIDVTWTNTTGRNIQVNTQDTALISDVGGAPLSHTFTWDGLRSATQLVLNPSGGTGNVVRITRLLVRGEGTNPFGADNCA